MWFNTTTEHISIPSNKHDTMQQLYAVLTMQHITQAAIHLYTLTPV